jgi:hypothetical protein
MAPWVFVSLTRSSLEFRSCIVTRACYRLRRDFCCSAARFPRIPGARTPNVKFINPQHQARLRFAETRSVSGSVRHLSGGSIDTLVVESTAGRGGNISRRAASTVVREQRKFKSSVSFLRELLNLAKSERTSRCEDHNRSRRDFSSTGKMSFHGMWI